MLTPVAQIRRKAHGRPVTVVAGRPRIHHDGCVTCFAPSCMAAVLQWVGRGACLNGGGGGSTSSAAATTTPMTRRTLRLPVLRPCLRCDAMRCAPVPHHATRMPHRPAAPSAVLHLLADGVLRLLQRLHPEVRTPHIGAWPCTRASLCLCGLLSGVRCAVLAALRNAHRIGQ